MKKKTLPPTMDIINMKKKRLINYICLVEKQKNTVVRKSKKIKNYTLKN